MKLINKKFSFNVKNFLLVLPFILIALLLIIIPTMLVIVKSFIPTSGGGVDVNWNYIDGFIWQKILKSFIIALIATFFCMIVAYPFAYFLSFNNNKLFKSIVLTMVTAPIWISFLVKLIGLKTFFDVMNGFSNSTYGDIFTIIGLTYIYIPFMIIPIYSVLEEMPKNLVFASRDLGCGSFKTFINIVIPYTKVALISGITLVFLPCITTVAVPQFLNNSPNSSTIGDIIIQEGEQGLTSDIALARASSLSLVLAFSVLFVFSLLGLTQKSYKKLKRGRKNV